MCGSGARVKRIFYFVDRGGKGKLLSCAGGGDAHRVRASVLDLAGICADGADGR